MTQLKGQHLHFDCASGAAGDMLLGACLDLGVPLEAVGAALDAVEAPGAAVRTGRSRLDIARIVKHGIAAVSVHVATDAPQHDHGSHPHHQHDAHHHPAKHEHSQRAHGPLAPDHAHRSREQVPHHELASSHEPHAGGQRGHGHHHYAEIRSRIASASLTDGTRRRALDTFDRLARAEAKLHGTTVDRVRFHEVGAIDSIVDIVGTAAALDYLSPTSVSCASVAMGHGTLVSAHGVLPVPAPAALEVFRECGGVMVDGGVERELCTPTGAAILAAAVTDWRPAPSGRAVAIGWGAGDMELTDRANVVRAMVMALEPRRDCSGDGVWQIDANLDDMSPELCTPAADALFAAGALDVWWTPIAMKKGRPALLLSALASDARRDDVVGAVLRETSTIGVRYAKLERTVLARRIVEVETRFGAVAIKEARDGDRIVNAAPEYESCAAVARRVGVPIKVVYAAALAAYDAASR